MCTRRKWQNPWFIGDNGSKKRSIQSRETVVNHSELIVPLERADALCAFRQPTRAMLTKLYSFTIPPFIQLCHTRPFSGSIYIM